MKGLMQNWPLVVPTILDHAAKEHGERELVTRSVEGDIRRCTYADLHSRARQVAKALDAEGIKLGTRVATMAWNTDRHMEIWYGIMGIGAICHTLNPRLFPEQLTYIINHAEDEILFIEPDFLPIIEGIWDKLNSIKKIIVLTDQNHLPETSLEVTPYEEWLSDYDNDFRWSQFDENTAAGLCYTSGTTGNPKGVLYSHRSNVIHTLTINQPDAFGIKAEDSVMPVTPMFHANAWGLSFGCPMAGAKMVMPGSKLDGESIFELLDSEQVTIATGVPTIWQMLLQHLEKTGKELPNLNRVVIGGSACPQVMIETFQKRYNVDVIHAWGMTELSPLGTTSTLKPGMNSLSDEEKVKRKLKQGRVPYTVEIKITDDVGNELPRDGKTCGNLLVRGPAITKSYFKSEEPSVLDKDGWFHTGDVANIDPLGYVQITDRSKDIIKSGGEWISSIDIENIAVGHPRVAEAAVIGLPHKKWGERPLLVVVRAEHEDVSKEEILKYLEGKIAKWWTPDDVKFVDEIPHTAVGKIHKLTLRRQFQDYTFPDS